MFTSIRRSAIALGAALALKERDEAGDHRPGDEADVRASRQVAARDRPGCLERQRCVGRQPYFHFVSPQAQ